MIQLNWGHKLAIVIVLFLVVMLAMVFYAARQDNEMIDDNYYQKELGYQDLIDAQKNLLAVSANNIVSQDMDEVIFTLPVGTFEGLDSGRVELLRNDAQRLDKSLVISPDGTNRRSIPKAETPYDKAISQYLALDDPVAKHHSPTMPDMRYCAGCDMGCSCEAAFWPCSTARLIFPPGLGELPDYVGQGVGRR